MIVVGAVLRDNPVTLSLLTSFCGSIATGMAVTVIFLTKERKNKLKENKRLINEFARCISEHVINIENELENTSGQPHMGGMLNMSLVDNNNGQMPLGLKVYVKNLSIVLREYSSVIKNF